MNAFWAVILIGWAIGSALAALIAAAVRRWIVPASVPSEYMAGFFAYAMAFILLSVGFRLTGQQGAVFKALACTLGGVMLTFLWRRIRAR